MSNIEEVGVLKYGDIIKLDCDNLFLLGKGLTYHGLYWGKKENNSDQCLSAFRVLPKSINIIQSELLTARKVQVTEQLNINLESLKLEIMNNIHHYSKVVGTAVTVGSNIELQHLATNKYLGVQLEISANSSHEFLKFKLKDSPDDTCLIRLEPVFNFQREKSKIMDGDKVYFEVWISKLNAPIYMFKQGKNVFASFENKSRVKLILTCAESELEPNSIFSWNYVFIKDSENNLSLSLSEDEDEIIFTNDIDLSNCLWRLENDAPCGISPGKSFKIRHITKKKYLTLNLRGIRRTSLFTKAVTPKSSTRKSGFEVQLGDAENEFNYWVVNPINPAKSKYIKSQFCTIFNEKSGLFLSMDYLQMEKCYPCLEEKVNNNIYFQIFKCNEEIAGDAAYADEIVSRLQVELAGIIEEGFYRDLKGLFKCLKTLENFLLNQTFCLTSENGVVGEVSKFRQDILRNQKIFLVIFKILDQIAAISTEIVRKAAKELFSNLVLLCEDNQVNKSEILANGHVIKRYLELDIFYSEKLVEIVQDFKEGHQKYSALIHELIIEHIRIIKEKKNINYVNFLLTVSVCDGQGMSASQDLIITKLFTENGFFKLPKIEDKSVLFEFGEKVRLEDCFEEGRLVIFYDEVNKFTTLLKLMSHLCEGRNYNSIQKVMRWFPLNILLEYVYNERIPMELRAYFLTLVNKVYIDVAPRFEIDFPDYVIDQEFRPLESKVFHNYNKVSPLMSLKEEHLEANELSPLTLMNQNDKEINVLKNYLLEYFKNSDNVYSSLKLVLLKLVNLMARMNLLNDGNSKLEENTQTMLLIGLTKIIKTEVLVESHSGSYVPEKTHEKKVETNFEFLRKQKGKRTAVMTYSTKVVNCLNQSQRNKEYDVDYTDDCVLEVLQMFTFYLNWRQDKILKQFFSNPNFAKSPEKFLKTVPPVIQSRVKKGKKKTASTITTKTLIKLLELVIKCKKIEVKSLSLSLIVRSCYMIRETLGNIYKTEFLKDPVDISVHKYLNKTKKVFTEIAEQSEIWIHDESDSRYEEFSIILSTFSKLLYENSNLVENVPFAEEEKISVIRQNIFFNTKIHIIIMKFINDSVYFIDKSEKIQIILKQSHKILANIIKDHKSHQEYFKKYIKSLLTDLKYDIGQVNTICEIYNNNYELCNSVDVQLLNLFRDSIIKYGRQARFLKFYQVIQIADNDPILDMQLKVINCLFDKNYYKYLCYSKGEDDISFIFEEENNGDEPISYHAELLKVMCKSTRGTVDIEINESKCKKILSLSNLFYLLERSESVPYFKLLTAPLLEFFYEVYLDSKQRLPHTVFSKDLMKLLERVRINFSNIRKEELSLIIKILKKYTEIYSINSGVDDELAIECEKLLDQIYMKRSTFSGFNDHEMTLNLEQLYSNFMKNYNFELDQNEEIEINIVDEVKILKNNFNHEAEFKTIRKQEKELIADIIFEAKRQGNSIKSILNELLIMIKYYKLRKISKKTVFTCIMIIKTLILDYRVEEESRSALEDLNGQSLILQILSEKDTESSIFQKLLILLIKLLKQGTSDTQNLFHSHFTNNQESEVFFKILASQFSRFKVNSKEISLPFLKSICKTLKFFQLLCENHNTLLQNYLRFQEKSLISFNFINIILVLLESLIKSKELFTYEAADLCFDTLTELCQGPCKENQMAVIDSNFVEIANELLGVDESRENLQPYQSFQQVNSSVAKGEALKSWMVTNLKHKALITLHSLLEGNEDNSITSRMLRSINIDILYRNMIDAHVYHLANSEVLVLNGERVFKLEVGIRVYHLLRIFQDNPTKENQNVVKGLLPDIYFDKSDFNYLGKEVELAGEDENSLLPTGKFRKASSMVDDERLSDILESKKFENAVRFYEKRTGNIDVILPGNVLSKIYFWLDVQCASLSEDMKYDFHYNADRSSDKNKLEYLLSRVDDIRDHIEHEYLVSKLITNYRIIRFLSKVIIWKVVCFIASIMLFILTVSLYDPSMEKNVLLWNLTDLDILYKVFHVIEIIHLTCSSLILIFYFLKVVPVQYLKAKRSSYFLVRHYRLLQAISIFTNIETLYLHLYVSFSVFGSFFHIYFFAFNLLDFVYLFPILQSVMISIIQPLSSFVLLFALIVLVMYQFSIISYIYFYPYFNKFGESLFLCTYQSVSEGIKNTGGVGTYTNYQISYKGELKFPLFLFDNTNNIINFIILWNILTGVTINAFAIIRGEKGMNLKDQISKCFICGIMKNDIEEVTKKPFKFHRKYEHNEWNYIFFIIYLMNKDEQEYSGIESIIIKEVDKASIKWIPQGRGFSLKDSLI